MTFSLATKVSKEGRIFTYEYNQQRADTVRSQFSEMKIDNVMYFNKSNSQKCYK